MSRAAALRFSRDKRGYEYFSLVEPSGRGGDGGRVLYLFRTPPGVKVGRAPFDESTRRALEAQNPGVTFDWPRLVSAPVPATAPEVERWRDRRRQERAEKAARAALRADAPTPDEVAPDLDSESDVEDVPADERNDDEIDAAPASESTQPAANSVEAAPVHATSQAGATGPGGPPEPGHHGRRRRRRRRRHGRSDNRPAQSAPQSAAEPKPPESNE